MREKRRAPTSSARLSGRPPRGSSILAVGLAACVAGPALAQPALLDFWQPAAASPGPDATARWIRLGDARVRQGRFAAAAASYVAALAAGSPAPAVSIRLGDALMADGELLQAESAYRDAIAAASATAPTERDAVGLDDPRGRTQNLALARFGLAAALDRAGQGGAARQMAREGLAADPTAAVLEVATFAGADVRIAPEGEVFYRLALARLVGGRRTDAAAAFHEYLDRLPRSRWADAAQAHLAELEAPAARRPGQRAAGGARLVAAATVLASGGTPAPLIDAAWREQGAILDDCLDAAAGLAPGGGPLRVAIEMEIDRRGHVVSAVAKVPIPGAGSLVRCLEQAVRDGLRLPASSGARPTRARTELLVSFPNPL
jgi:tetratricopeptide (TPR) repeat protein